jgi:hypothetical protein
VCGQCNRSKLTQFPLDARGEPLLIDPTVEDPALHLDTSPQQGRLVARNGSLKGQTTIDVLNMLRILELPDPGRYLDDPGCVETLRSLAPEIRAWLADGLD